MRGSKSLIVLVCVALSAALIGHVVIDVLGDYLLAHDTYDDLDHTSRALVALVTLALALTGIGYGLRAAIREARGCENAFCCALRRALPNHPALFFLSAIVGSTLILCVMEECDALLAGHVVDDVGDLFGGSIMLGGGTIAFIAFGVSSAALYCLRRLAQTRRIAGIVVAFLRRCLAYSLESETDRTFERAPIFRALRICRRIAGRAPPPPCFATT